MQNFFQIILFIILLGCSNKYYSVEKKPICNISQNKDILEVNCNEHDELYFIKYNNLDKTFFNCKKISFDIYIRNELTKKSYLECYLKNNKKKFIFKF